jgi:hypothetical protein
MWTNCKYNGCSFRSEAFDAKLNFLSYIDVSIANFYVDIVIFFSDSLLIASKCNLFSLTTLYHI